jgi:hypothetical protein
MLNFKFKSSKLCELSSGKHNLINEPFLVCSIDDFLDEKLYEELFNCFPPKDFFVNPNPDKGNKIALDGRSDRVQQYIETNSIWKKFTESINSNESSKFFKSLFDSHIPKRDLFQNRSWITDLNFYKTKSEIDRDLDANYIRYSFEFSYMENGAYIPPHTDSKNKVISMIFYFADPEIDWFNYSCGTSFFKLNKGARSEFKSWESVHLEGQMLEDFYEQSSVFHRSEFKPNKFLLFIKSDISWHEVKPIQLPKNISRKAFIVNIFC